MANSPNEQRLAIIGNMAAKTGKTIFEWAKILADSGLVGNKEQIAWLKMQYALGHFQASVIAQYLKNEGKCEYDEERLINDHFLGENAPMREIYDEVLMIVMAYGHDVKIKPCKTYLPFFRKTQFLVIKASKGLFYLGLPIHCDFNGRFTNAKAAGVPERMKSVIVMQSKADLTQDIISLMREAYVSN